MSKQKPSKDNLGLSDEELNALPTLQRTMMRTFGVFVSISLAVIFAILLVSIILTGQATQNISEDGLNDQINSHLRSSAIELSAKIGLRLSTLENSVVKFMSSIHGQTASNEDVLAAVSPDYRDQELPESDLQLIPRYDDRPEVSASLNHSVWYAAGNVQYNSLSNAGQEIVAHSSKMSYFYYSLWRNHDSIIAMYTGYDTEGLYRYYPGRQNLGGDSSPFYDPRIRGWYSTGKSLDGEVAHDGPYVDAFGHGWMITIAQAVYDSGNNIVGVSGADVTIKRLQEEILRVGFFGDSTASMVKIDGSLVADPFWDSSAQENNPSATAPLVWDVHPGITSTFWNDQLSDTSSGAKIFKYTQNGEQWILARSFIPLHPNDRPGATNSVPSSYVHHPRYVVFVEARVSDVQASLEDMRDEISTSRTQLIFIALGLCIAVWLIVMGLITYMSMRITKPLRKMMETAQIITNQAADDSSVQGRLSTDIPEPNDEIGEFVREFKTMVHGLNKGGVKGSRVQAYIPNPFHQGKRPWDGLIDSAKQAELLSTSESAPEDGSKKDV